MTGVSGSGNRAWWARRWSTWWQHLGQPPELEEEAEGPELEAVAAGSHRRPITAGMEGIKRLVKSIKRRSAALLVPTSLPTQACSIMFASYCRHENCPRPALRRGVLSFNVAKGRCENLPG